VTSSLLRHEKRYQNNVTRFWALPNRNFWLRQWLWVLLTKIVLCRRREGHFEWSKIENGKLERGKYSNWLQEEVDVGNFVPQDPNHTKNCVTWSWSLTPGWKTQNCSHRFYFLCQVIQRIIPVTVIVHNFMLRNAILWGCP